MNETVYVRDSRYTLIETASGEFILRFEEKNIGWIDPIPLTSDKARAVEMLRGRLFRVMVSTPYDATNDSDAAVVGIFEKEEAVRTLWGMRESIVIY